MNRPIEPVSPVVAALRAGFAARRPMRAGSLILTVFGDLIAPRGGGVRLSGLIPLLARFGVNDSQTRTALSRLSGDGWMTAERIGRESYYSLSDTGARRVAEASLRIYHPGPDAWDGIWHIALLPQMTRDRRQAVTRPFAWAGFGELGPGILLHPAPDRDSLTALMADLAPTERPTIVVGPALPGPPAEALQDLVARAWDLSGLARGYADFLTGYRALAVWLDHATPTPEEAVIARLLLVHDYRRQIMRDPHLPADLLAPDWVGAHAHALIGACYRGLCDPAETWIDIHLRGRDGNPLPAATGLSGRFPRAGSI